MATMTAHHVRQPILFLAVLAALGLSFVAGEKVGARGAPISSRLADPVCADARQAPASMPDGAVVAGDSSGVQAASETSADCNTDYR